MAAGMFPTNALTSVLRTGGSIGAAVVRPVARRVHAASLATLDALLASSIAGEVVDHVATSPLTQRGVSRTLEGPLVEAFARDLARYRVAERLLSEGLVEQTATRMLDGPELERIVEAALESPTTERLIGRVIESRLLDETVDQLLESKELWLLVEEIARSPAVTEAITRQSIGFADQVAGGVRTRSRSADAWLEQRVRRVLRRRPAPRVDRPGGVGPR
jgi:hypothetical protein